MPFNTARMGTSFAGMQAMLPVTVVIGGKTIQGIKVALDSEKALSVAGEYENVEFGVHMLVSALTTAGITIDGHGHLKLSSARQKAITVDGNTYRITGTRTDPAKVAVLVGVGVADG